MAYREKHGGIGNGIGSGKSNSSLSSEYGVSRGMIQKHRSGETASGNGGMVSSSLLLDDAVIRRMKEENRFREMASECDALCVGCGVITVNGTCPVCGRNVWQHGTAKLNGTVKCRWCDNVTDNFHCTIHGWSR